MKYPLQPTSEEEARKEMEAEQEQEFPHEESDVEEVLIQPVNMVNMLKRKPESSPQQGKKKKN